jgi:hypothetical protein
MRRILRLLCGVAHEDRLPRFCLPRPARLAGPGLATPATAASDRCNAGARMVLRGKGRGG